MNARPTWIDTAELEKSYRRLEEQLLNEARSRARDDEDRLLVDMQAMLADAKIAAQIVLAKWHNEERHPVARAQALASFLAVVMRSFVMNCPDGAQPLLGFLEMLIAADGDAAAAGYVEANARMTMKQGGEA